MGCVASGHKDYWEANKDIFEDEIHFRKNEINRLHTKFVNCDIRNTGSIKSDEFFAYFQLEPDAMNQKIFYSLDVRGDGTLDFCQFVCTLWNFLSLPVDQLGAYAHFLFDDNKNGKALKPNTAKDLIEVLYQQKCEKNSGAQKIYDKFRKQKFIFSVAKFTKWSKSNTALLGNLIGRHQKLQVQILGKEYWNILSKNRGGLGNEKLMHPLHIYHVLVKRYNEMELEKESIRIEKELQEENEKNTADKDLDGEKSGENDQVDEEEGNGDEEEEGEEEEEEEEKECEEGEGIFSLQRGGGGIILPSLEKTVKKKKKKKRIKGSLSKNARIAILEAEEVRIKEAAKLQKKKEKRDKKRREKRSMEEKELEKQMKNPVVTSVTFARRLSQRLTASMTGIEREHMREKLREDRIAAEVEAGVRKPEDTTTSGNKKEVKDLANEGGDTEEDNEEAQGESQLQQANEEEGGGEGIDISSAI